MDSPENTGWNEDSELHPTCGFDYASLDKPEDSLTPEEIEHIKEELRLEIKAEHVDDTIRAVTAMMRWVYQAGAKNPNGVLIRSIALCWVLLPNLKHLSQTEMAGKFGLEKESLGRWVAGEKTKEKRVMEGKPLKEEFPGLKISHLKFE
jgi:hypothetical protein